MGTNGTGQKVTLLRVLLVGAAVLLGNLWVQAQSPLRPVTEIRTIYTSEWGIGYPMGLAYSANFDHFFLLNKTSSTVPTVVVLTPYEDLLATVPLHATAIQTITLTFDDTANRLLLLTQDLTGLIQIQTDSQGIPNPAAATISPLAHVGLQSAQGMAVDDRGKFLFIFDAVAGQLVRIKLTAKLEQGQVHKFALPPTVVTPTSRGLALNPRNRHLYLANAGQQILWELNQSGQLVAQYDLASVQLADPQALVYARSADRTDAAEAVHLFIADSQHSPDQRAAQQSALSPLSPAATPVEPIKFGSLVEVALDRLAPEVSPASTQLVPLTLVRTIDTAAFSPPSPDPAGITYLASSQTLLVSDSEVDEMPAYFTGNNLFAMTLVGALAAVNTAVPHSNEPTDVAHNPNNNHIFISDDQKRRIFEFNPGADGVLNTSDDSVTSFSTTAFNAMDPEGLDYDAGSGHLFISDGVNNEIYRVNPGPNGRFDGIPSSGGDDIVTNFDVAVLAINDPEGVDFVPATGNLILITNGSDTRMYEVSTTGALVNTYDVSAANAMRLGGVQVAPSSVTPGVMNYYLVDRRVDNNADPNENDGKIYELTDDAAPPTPTPTPSPTPPDNDLIFVSSTSSGTAGGVTFADEDVLVYNQATATWSIYFDGSDVVATSLDVDAIFRLPDDALLLSFASDATVSTLGLVDDSDIVKFTPTSLGTVTAGTFSWYFDGSDVELTTSSEDLDALAVLADGRLLLSTVSTFSVTGLSAADEDLVVFTPTQLGENTAGAWAPYFDGSDVGLTDSTEDVNGTWVDPATGEIYLTTTGLFAVTGASGDGADLFICTPSSLGATTACTYRLYWDGSAQGFAGEITDAIYIEKSTAISSSTPVAPGSVVHDGTGDDPLADPHEGPDDQVEAEPPADAQNPQIFLPLLAR